MTAEIITIGDEILIGQIVDTNSAWMAQQLNAIGISIGRITSVSDSQREIINALCEASLRAKLVLVTGGLGPTKDDITKKAIYEYFKTSPVINQYVLKHIQILMKQRNVKMNELNTQQAEVASNCEVIFNEAGTAPGMWFNQLDVDYIFMPGVPFEMENMMIKEILPKLKKRFPLPFIYHKTINTTGIAESMLAQKIEGWENSLPSHIKLAYLPSPGIVRLRLTSRGSDNLKIVDETNSYLNKLQSIITEHIYSYDDERIEEVIGNLLLKSKKTIATAESCTGGNIACMITSVPGSSAYFKGSVVAYANEIKEAFLKIEKSLINNNGAVSQSVAEAMAQHILDQFHTDYSIAVSGIAGPTGGSHDKPVGTTWIAVANKEKIVSEKFLFGEHRGRNITRATIAALNMLRICIINSDYTK
jgi:nicotinamide-nucleotide amidase